MKKKIFSLFAILLASLVVSACSSSESVSDGKGKAGDTIDIRISGQSPDDHPSTQSLYKFAEQVKEKTDGRINVKVYPANQLGDYTTVYQEVGQGTIDMALISLPGELDDRLRLNFVPYLIEDYKDIEKTIGTDSYVFNKLQEINNEQGVQLLGFYANGFGGIGTAKEMTNLLDLGEDKGLLIRVPPDDVFKKPMEDIGFRTVTIPYADLYTSLQTGSADGWSGGEASLNYLGFRDVIKYFYSTNDFFNADAFIINKNLFEKINKEDRKIIEDLSEEMMAKSIETVENYDKEYREKLEEEGIKVVQLNEEEIQKLAEHVRKNTWPELKDHLGDDIIDELMKQ
ncbi:TRAP transporter substrate-binding protein DctP [Pseudalkalibacillus salsuginis]|uniref:TRAP transporter substrate-binding protein DctP n=1 Tax=Pseudalkalibacillus salsuginis TaxID=2910972 RepID=UPI001F35629D|nr:TRAP transporter substrate-binding protein DctP [Pseudalkalibacillus salsuginis]MCF6409110.1 TRAP transporter substrate-binding protein DctP [Pseudalkalibacillus salsuginis]